jgi:nitrogenase molybdenum-iron protein alpha/beta subunit
MSKRPLTIFPARRMLGVINLLMTVPENHVLFIGSPVCARHDMTMGLYEYWRNISFLTLNELELIRGDFDQIIDKAITRILNKARPKPQAITLYTGCPMQFMAADFDSLLQNLEEKHGIYFGHFRMNRMKTSGRQIFPQLFKSLFSYLRLKEKKPTINLLGSTARLEPENELEKCLAQASIEQVLTLKAMEDFRSFTEMGASRANIILHANYLLAARDMEKRLGIPWIYLPVVYDPEQIEKQYAEIGNLLGCDLDIAGSKQNALDSIEKTKALVGDTPLVFDVIGIHKPFSMLVALVKMGFKVTGFKHAPYDAYCDQSQTEALEWLKLSSKVDTEHNERLEFSYERLRPAQMKNNSFEGAYFGFAAVEHLMHCIREAYHKNE